MPLVYSVASLVELEEVGAQVQISRRGYFQFFFFFFRSFSFVVLLPFGLFPFILTAEPLKLREIFTIAYV